MRRPIILILTVLVMVAIAAALVVSAQDEEPSQQLEAYLPLTENVRYEVGVGDTLDFLASIFDVSVQCLVDINALENKNRIFVGQQLIISVECPPYIGDFPVPYPREVSLGVGGGADTYTVQVADTLEDIARLFNISVISLQEYNSIANPNQITVGQVLEIPSGVPPFGQVPAFDNGSIEAGGAEGDIIYVMQIGDTLDVIGAFYNASPACIAEANGITNNRTILPRETILIPEACAPYIGPNTVGGRILPIDGAPTIAPTSVISVTPRSTLEITPTFMPVTGVPTTDATDVTDTIDATPTAEGVDEIQTEQGGGSDVVATADVTNAVTEEVLPTEIEPTEAPILEASPTNTRPATFTPAPTATPTLAEPSPTNTLPATFTVVPAGGAPSLPATPTAEGLTEDLGAGGGRDEGGAGTTPSLLDLFTQAITAQQAGG